MNCSIYAENKSGIYEIYNVKNNKRYIGQSIHVRTRLLKHLNFLRKNEHENQHLQNSWNKHGECAFEFNVVEYCDIESLNEKEDYYIAMYNTGNKDFGYNKKTDNVTNKGLKWSEEHRENFNKAIERNPWFHNHKIPRETMEKAWESCRGRIMSEEERRNRSKSLKGHKKVDTSKMKLAQQGSKNPSSKLSENDVIEIICLCKNSYCSHQEVANAYNVCLGSIRSISCGRTWKHIDRNKINEELYYLKGVDKINDYRRANQRIS